MAQNASTSLQVGNENPDGEDGRSRSEDIQKKPKQGPRKRVSQACDKCRSRKDKCDGKKPACSTCTTNGRICSYDANVKKRGLPEGYVRGLEKLWGLAIRDVDAVQDNVLLALAGDEDSLETPLSKWNDETNSENLVELWRKSQISRELERLLSSQELSGETKKRRLDSDAPILSDPGLNNTSSQASYQYQQTRNGVGNAQKPGWTDKGIDRRLIGDFRDSPKIPNFEDNAVFMGEGFESILTPSTPHAAVTNGAPLAAVVEMPDLPSETWHLLDVYFSYTHAWLPIIEKHDLLRTSYQYSQARTSHTMANPSGEYAALWAIIAYAKFQHRAINNIPHALGSVGEMVWTAERMYTQARNLIPNEEGSFELGHVQALLILALTNIGQGRYSRAWSLVGQAVRTGIDIQLDQPSEMLSTKSKSRSKHVFLGCFALDTLIAARLGRRPHLRTEDLDLLGLIDEDGLEEWDPWTDCLNVRRNNSNNSRVPASILSTFNQLIQVLKILNESVCLPSGSDCLQASTVLLQKLHIWSQAQNPPLYFDSTAIGSEQATSLLPHQYHLHNIYFTTLAASQLLSHAHGRESANLEPCTRSARQIASLINQHSSIFGLLIVPPTYEFFVKTAFDVVYAVNGSIENTHIVLDDWKRRLENCIEAMEPAWPVFETFKTSVEYQSISHTRRESQVAYDLMSGMSQDADTPMSGKTPQSLASYDAMNSYSPQVLRPQASSELTQSRSTAQGNLAAKLVDRSSSFGQSSGHGLPSNPLNIYQSAHAKWGNAQPHMLANKMSTSRGILETSSQHRGSFEIIPPDNPRLHRSLTMSSTDVEIDPMFNELMRLDATEWVGNWDQSLMNLGFTDTDNMNQDFVTFCQEPDPLHQNTVFQQLVANSNAEATDFFDTSAFVGMVAFGGVTGMGEENEGIEAGQILQALSAAEDGRSGR